MVLALMDDMESKDVVPDKADHEPHDSSEWVFIPSS